MSMLSNNVVMRILIGQEANITLRYTLLGFLFGLTFPIISIIIDANFQGLEYNFATFSMLHQSNPIHYIIDTAPFFLGLFAWFIGRNARKYKIAMREAQVQIAEREAAESALEESTGKFSIFAEQNLLSILILQDGNFKYANQASSDLLEYSVEEMMRWDTRQISLRVHPEDREFVMEQARKKEAGDTDVVTTYPFRLILKSGKVKWVELYSKGFQLSGKSAVFITLIDITDREKAEEELKASEKRYREFFESLIEGIGLVDENEIILNCNPAYAEIFEEPSHKDMIGKCLLDYIPQSDHSRIATQTAYRRKGKKNLYEVEIITAKNNRKTLQVFISPRFDKQGNYIAALGSLIDITERKMAEQALRESEEKYRDLVENMNEVVFSLDSSGVINYISPAIERFSQYNPNDLIDHKLSEYIHEDDRESYIETLLRNMLGQISTAEYRFAVKSGEINWIHLSNKPVFMGDKIVGVQGILKDITERKLAEQKHVELQKKLEDAERMESLGLLAGGIAHDLNNTLGPMVGYSDLILQQLEKDNPMYKKVERIQKASGDAAEVIQDLLSMARRGRYEMETMNLNDVIRAYLESPGYLKLARDNPGVELTTSLNNNAATIRGSAPHLSKVVMNLIVNAYDAMPEGGLLALETSLGSSETTPRGTSEKAHGEYFVFKVSDTGSGIKPDDIDKIFEPYYSSKKMGASGSGLGLSVVHGVLKDHGGYSDVRSEVGQGTEFYLYFPLTDEKISRDIPKGGNYKGDETILIVDDAWEQREIMTALLSSLNYNVITAVNGRDSLKILEKEDADLVILDMIMEKDFDGLDTYREIIKLKPAQKAIVISGFSATDRVKEMQKLGAGAFVKKPFTRNDIGKAVRQELNADSREMNSSKQADTRSIVG
ncbi:MAG: PAS domain S-box protein [candidate division Zixibacteria bacterium]|nr:PAS domain S-box protein [candidate division Zixibacteria bacterium]